MNLLRRENVWFRFFLQIRARKSSQDGVCVYESITPRLHDVRPLLLRLISGFLADDDEWSFFQGLMPTIGRDVNCFSPRFEVKSEVAETLLHLIDELTMIIADSSRKCASVGEVLRTFHRHMQSSGRKCFALNTFSREMNHDLSPRKWKPDQRPDYVCSKSQFRDCFSSKQHTSSMMSSTGMDTSK